MEEPNVRKEMGETNRQWAEKKYGLKKYGKSVEEVLKRMMAF
jgi:hypothetical protein